MMEQLTKQRRRLTAPPAHLLTARIQFTFGLLTRQATRLLLLIMALILLLSISDYQLFLWPPSLLTQEQIQHQLFPARPQIPEGQFLMSSSKLIVPPALGQVVRPGMARLMLQLRPLLI